MPDVADLAATLRRLIGHHQIHLPARIEPDRSGVNDLYDVMMADDEAFACTCEDYEAAFIEFAANNASAIAAALERGAAVERCYHEAVGRIGRLMTVLMESIQRGEGQGAQLELIADAGDAFADWDDESRALWVRAKAVAAKNAADRERGAAAEAVIAAFRVWRLNQHSVQGWMSNGRLEVSMLTAMAAYDALKEATDG